MFWLHFVVIVPAQKVPSLKQELTDMTGGRNKRERQKFLTVSNSRRTTEWDTNCQKYYTVIAEIMTADRIAPV